MKDFTQTQNETNHLISENLMIIRLKAISNECFLFNENVNTNIKFIWTLEGLWEDT